MNDSPISPEAVAQMVADREAPHQSQLAPEENKFHVGNGGDGKHYWLTPPDLLAQLGAEFNFDFDPCPFPKPDDFDGLTQPWGQSSYVNPPFGSIIHEGKKKGPTAWARKSIAEAQQGKDVVLVYPIDKWVLMLIAAGAEIRNLGDVRWMATEDGSQGKGTGRHIAAFILRGSNPPAADMLTTLSAENATLRAERDRLATAHKQLMQSLDAANARAENYNLFVEALSEIKATVDGQSDQSVKSIIDAVLFTIHENAAYQERHLALRDKPAPAQTVQEGG